MWNAWGYNTEQRPNHQVVKFLNAIICVPTVSCGYKIVPKNLEVREHEAQTKQILSNIFSPSFHPDAAECPSLLTSQHALDLQRKVSLCGFFSSFPFAREEPWDLAKVARSGSE